MSDLCNLCGEELIDDLLLEFGVRKDHPDICYDCIPSDGFEQIKDCALYLELPLTPCGLNADWFCQAWHLGPSKFPNSTANDYYVIDSEDGSYSLARYFIGEDEGGNRLDEIIVSAPYDRVDSITDKMKEIF